MTAVAPISVAVLILMDYIGIPSYPELWAILISGQVWCVVIEGSGTIASLQCFLDSMGICSRMVLYGR